MRDYGRVYSSFWTSADTQGLSDDGRLLALYLLSGPHGTLAGVCRLPDGYVCEDLKWATSRVTKGFDELLRNGFANRCGTTKWVWIRKFLAWNTPENPNQWKAARKIAEQVPPQCAWKAEFSRVFASAAGDPPPSDSNPSGTLPQPLAQPLPTQEQYQEQEQKQEQEQEQKPMSALPTDGSALERVFEHWRQIHNHPRAVLDDKRRKVIRDALKQRSESDLCQAICGYLNSPHHMGQNDSGTTYDDIGLFLRDAEHIDRGLKLYQSPPQNRLSAQTRKNIAATADWMPPELRHAAN